MSAMRARSTIALPLAALVLWTLFAPSVSTASVPTVLRESAVAAGIVGVSFALDGVIHPNVPDRLPGELVEEPGEITGNGAFLFGGTAALAVAGLVAGSPGAVHTARDLGLALTATSASVWLLKLTTHRERPDGSNHYSFPSGHTATAFAAASVLEHHYGWLAGLGAYTAAAMAGEARVADNHHYFSDVMAGAVLGTVIGHLVAHAP